VSKPIKTILVTSSGASEGKTSVAINLAVVMAQGGKKVILMDADLRRPSVSEKLGVPNNKGLSDLFLGQLEVKDVRTSWDVENVTTIMSGPPPPNPVDLLSSTRMDDILEDLKQDADIIILDGPPFLVADAGILASKVDGVLLVFRHGYTRREVARNATERFKRVGANVLGVVFNRIPRSGIDLYGHYGYGYEGYYSADFDDTDTSKESRRTFFSNLSGIKQNRRSKSTGSARRDVQNQEHGNRKEVEEQMELGSDYPLGGRKYARETSGSEAGSLPKEDIWLYDEKTTPASPEPASKDASPGLLKRLIGR
jgi:capsular exopolysaccharide synthesis family protein